ncbi:MAG TPA: ABC transporter substrate-binding protein [Rhodothermales bacterium]|jgi:NitT/TauT family transport system substrate-binding protein
MKHSRSVIVRVAAVTALAMMAVACGSSGPAASGGAANSTSQASISSGLTPATSADAAASASPSSSAPATSDVVRIGDLGVVSDAPFYIAEDLGFFKQQGIDVKLTRFASSPAVIAPLTQGQIDVAGGSPTAGLYNAIAIGSGFKIVADKAKTPKGFGYNGLIIRQDLWDSGVKDLAGLKGKTIAILGGKGSSSDAGLYRAATDLNLKLSDFKIIKMAASDLPAAFANKAIDAAVAIEPQLTQLVAGGQAAVWQRMDQYYPDHQMGLVLYSEKFIAAHPDTAAKFMTAYIQAARYYTDAFVKGDAAKRAEVVKILISHTTVKDPKLYDSMAMAYIDPNGTINVDTMNADQHYFVSEDAQDKVVDLSKAIDMSFVDSAVKALGPYDAG